MNTLTYNGYTGSVEFSEEDNVFFGKLEGINALVNYEGESVTELKNAFKEAVTDYLEFCKAEGITPEKKILRSQFVTLNIFQLQLEIQRLQPLNLIIAYIVEQQRPFLGWSQFATTYQPSQFLLCSLSGLITINQYNTNLFVRTNKL